MSPCWLTSSHGSKHDVRHHCPEIVHNWCTRITGGGTQRAVVDLLLCQGRGDAMSRSDIPGRLPVVPGMFVFCIKGDHETGEQFHEVAGVRPFRALLQTEHASFVAEVQTGPDKRVSGLIGLSRRASCNGQRGRSRSQNSCLLWKCN